MQFLFNLSGLSINRVISLNIKLNTILLIMMIVFNDGKFTHNLFMKLKYKISTVLH